MNTKGNLKSLPIEHYMVSSSEVVEYLQNQLGFPFDADFQICDNRADWEKPVATEKCFVIMRAVFRPEDICVSSQVTNYVDKVLVDAAAGMQFKDTVIDVLKPFMFPENMAARLQQNPDLVRMLAQQGLYGEKLDKIVRNVKPIYDKTLKRFGFYLMPDAIIKDMCKDPASNALDGAIAFGYVSGDGTTNASAITWGVNVYHNSHVALKGVDIDAVFNGAQNA